MGLIYFRERILVIIYSMTDETKYEWFHKNRQFFFLKEDGEITHCYQLAVELCSDVDKNRWWKMKSAVPKGLTYHKEIMIFDDNHTMFSVDDLVPVPADSEIEYQLFSLDDAKHPIAGVFTKNICERHPRRHQWGKLAVLNHIPERWLKGRTAPDDRDFVSAPFLTKAEQHSRAYIDSKVKKALDLVSLKEL